MIGIGFALICGLTLFGCNDQKVYLLKNVHSIAFPSVSVALRMDILDNGSYSHNLTPFDGDSTRLVPSEKALLEETVEDLEGLFLKYLDIDLVETIPASSNVVGRMQKKPDIRIFVPSKKLNLDFAIVENIKRLCSELKVDAVGCVDVWFVRIHYMQPFAGTFSRIEAKARIKIFTAEGELALSQEIGAESSTAVKEADLTNFFTGVPAPVILNYYTFDSALAPLFQESLENLVHKVDKAIKNATENN